MLLSERLLAYNMSSWSETPLSAKEVKLGTTGGQLRRGLAMLMNIVDEGLKCSS